MKDSVQATKSSKRAVWIELLTLYFSSLLAIKGIVALQDALALPADVLVAVPLVFLGVPVLWVRRLRDDPRDYGLELEDFGKALKEVGLLTLLILLPFAIGNHFYQSWIFGRSPVGLFPKSFLDSVVAYHLFFVGFPEEFFYRGYMQSRMNQVLPKRWRLFGADIGWGMILTAAFFALGHSVVMLRWWHAFIFFPALLFGWLRERTGNVVAPAIFHGLCNILMVTLDTYYGVIPP